MAEDSLDTTEMKAIRGWIAAKRSAVESISADMDLIENRLIDSLDFAEFLFFLEEVSGRTIELETVELDTFRTLRSIHARFLMPTP